MGAGPEDTAGVKHKGCWQMGGWSCEPSWLPVSGGVVLWMQVVMDCEVLPISGQEVQWMQCQSKQIWTYLSGGSTGGETWREAQRRGAS